MSTFRNKISRPYSSKIQSFGMGRLDVQVTMRQELQTSQGTTRFFAPMADLLINNGEFNRYFQDFEYFRVNLIGITIYPNPSFGNEPTYLQMDWANADAVDRGELPTMDNIKIVYNNNVRQRTFYFKPPSAQLPYRNVDAFYALNPRSALAKINDKIVFPGRIGIEQMSTGNFRIKTRIDFGITFLTPKGLGVSKVDQGSQTFKVTYHDEGTQTDSQDLDVSREVELKIDGEHPKKQEGEDKKEEDLKETRSFQSEQSIDNNNKNKNKKEKKKNKKKKTGEPTSDPQMLYRMMYPKISQFYADHGKISYNDIEFIFMKAGHTIPIELYETIEDYLNHSPPKLTAKQRANLWQMMPNMSSEEFRDFEKNHTLDDLLKLIGE